MAELVEIASSPEARDADKISALVRIADIRNYKAASSVNLKKATREQLESFLHEQVLPALVSAGAIVEVLDGDGVEVADPD